MGPPLQRHALATEVVDLRPHARQQQFHRHGRGSGPLQHPDLALLGTELAAHASDLVAHPVKLRWSHRADRSSGTSPNFRISLASPNSPVAGSPVRQNAIAPAQPGLRESASARMTAVWRSGTHRFASDYAAVGHVHRNHSLRSRAGSSRPARNRYLLRVSSRALSKQNSRPAACGAKLPFTGMSGGGTDMSRRHPTRKSTGASQSVAFALRSGSVIQ